MYIANIMSFHKMPIELNTSEMASDTVNKCSADFTDVFSASFMFIAQCSEQL